MKLNRHIFLMLSLVFGFVINKTIMGESPEKAGDKKQPYAVAAFV